MPNNHCVKTVRNNPHEFPWGQDIQDKLYLTDQILNFEQNLWEGFSWVFSKKVFEPLMEFFFTFKELSTLMKKENLDLCSVKYADFV